MLGLLRELTSEAVAGGLVGFFLIGVVIRNVILGWREAGVKMRAVEASPLATAMALTWDRNQIERALQLLESLAEGVEIQARSLEIIAKAQTDQFQQTTQSKLNDILERLDEAEQRGRPRR